MDRERIVVIDDCRLTLAIAKDLLEEAGFEVMTAETGIEANAYIYRNSAPRLILVDVVMPMLNGDRKVRLLKDREASRNIAVLLMSSKPEAELRELAGASGADGYVVKPLDKEALLREVRRLI